MPGRCKLCRAAQTKGKTVVGRWFDELKRRNVFRVAAAYLAGAWLVVQLMEALLPMFGLEETAGRLLEAAARNS